MRVSHLILFLWLCASPFLMKAQAVSASGITYSAVEIMNFSTSKMLPVLNNACNDQQGITIHAYCDGHKIVVFAIDLKYADENKLAVMLRNLHIDFIQKPSGILNDIMQHCGKDYHKLIN